MGHSSIYYDFLNGLSSQLQHMFIPIVGKSILWWAIYKSTMQKAIQRNIIGPCGSGLQLISDLPIMDIIL